MPAPEAAPPDSPEAWEGPEPIPTHPPRWVPTELGALPRWHRGGLWTGGPRGARPRRGGEVTPKAHAAKDHRAGRGGADTPRWPPTVLWGFCLFLMDLTFGKNAADVSPRLLFVFEFYLFISQGEKCTSME